jgi:hypothetical protein
MSDALVRAAFETRVAAWAAALTPPVPVAYQNVPFSPPAGRYVRCWLLPAPTLCRTLNGEHRERRGVFQADLCLPLNVGSADLQSLIASLDAAFPLNGPLVQGSLSVYLLTPMSGAAGRPDGTHYVVPVSCTYENHTV